MQRLRPLIRERGASGSSPSCNIFLRACFPPSSSPHTEAKFPLPPHSKKLYPFTPPTYFSLSLSLRDLPRGVVSFPLICTSLCSPVSITCPEWRQRFSHFFTKKLIARFGRGGETNRPIASVAGGGPQPHMYERTSEKKINCARVKLSRLGGRGEIRQRKEEKT